MTNEVVERLDQIAAILRLAHRDAIERTRTAIRSDKVNAAILDGSTKWIAAGKLQAAVVSKTKTSSRTVQFRIADLLVDGLLEKRGGGPTTEYKASGLI
jgi:hypothetical protein